MDKPSIRVQIDLPGRRKTILRVNPQIFLSDLLRQACEDASLGSPELYDLHGAKTVGYPLRMDLQLVHVGTVDFAVTLKPNVSAKREIFTSSSFNTVNEHHEEKMGCFRSLFRRKKRPTRTVSQWTITPSVPEKSTNGFPSSPAVECEIPSEPSPPPPVPPGSTAPKKRRPAPHPPAYLTPNVTRAQRSGSECSYETTVAQISPSLSPAGTPKYGNVGNGRSSSPNFLNVAADDSIRTLASGQSTIRTESTASEVLKKRKAPPPPRLEQHVDGREVPAPDSLVKYNSSSSLQCDASSQTQLPPTFEIKVELLSRQESHLIQSECEGGTIICVPLELNNLENGTLEEKAHIEVQEERENSLQECSTGVSPSDITATSTTSPRIEIVPDEPGDVPPELHEDAKSAAEVNSPPSDQQPSWSNSDYESSSINGIVVDSSQPGKASTHDQSPRQTTDTTVTRKTVMRISRFFRPQMNVTNFEEDYYFKHDHGDYARMIKYEKVKERQKSNTNGTRWEIPKPSSPHYHENSDPHNSSNSQECNGGTQFSDGPPVKLDPALEKSEKPLHSSDSNSAIKKSPSPQLLEKDKTVIDDPENGGKRQFPVKKEAPSEKRDVCGVLPSANLARSVINEHSHQSLAPSVNGADQAAPPRPVFPTRPVSKSSSVKQANKVDVVARGDLMESIRNFGGIGYLKKTGKTE